jgi:hypothetical protein
MFWVKSYIILRKLAQIFSSVFQNKIIFNFVKFVATKKGMTKKFFHPFLLLLFLDPGSEIRDKRPGSAALPLLYVAYPQNNELTRGPSELVSTFVNRGEFTSAQERCLTLNWYGLAISPAYPSGEEGGTRSLPVQIISTWRHKLRGRGGGAPCGRIQYQAVADPFSVNFARVLIGQWINQ